MDGWGSWEWLGEEMLPEFSRFAKVSTFTYDEEPPRHGQVIIIKHPPPRSWQHSMESHRLPVIYAPVDYYESVNAIDADAPWLASLQHVVIHCQRLRPYFTPYVPVTYIDHQLRFISSEIVVPRRDGPILWVGVSSNLPPLITWLQQHTLSKPLCVLTNAEPVDAMTMGFQENRMNTMLKWSPQSHLSLLLEASAALDVKGHDFRSRHKPPTKAFDFLACGLPLAMEADSSSAEHLRTLGFEVADPAKDDRWFSDEYAQECQRFASEIRGTHGIQQIANQWRRLLLEQ